MQDGDEALTETEHRQYRRTTGKLLWSCPVRPDLCYATKELSRTLRAPTKEDEAKVRHLLRYIKGTKLYKFILRPTITLPRSTVGMIDLPTDTDSDWAGDIKTRKSTTGYAVSLLGSTAHFGTSLTLIHI